MRSKKTITTVVVALLLGGLGYVGSKSDNPTVKHGVSLIENVVGNKHSGHSYAGSTNKSNGTSQPVTGGKATSVSGDDKTLSKMDYKSGGTAYTYVNHNKATISMGSWKTNKIDYGKLDSLNRTTTDTGYLTKANLVKSDTRTAQRFNPTGWHNQPVQVAGKRTYVQNRGHLLAYSVTGNFDANGKYTTSHPLGSLDNPLNLATQTAVSNQKTMQVEEGKVRDSLAKGNKVIYKVSTVFRGNELMPRGYHSQAVSSDGKLNFNVYIWNVEPGVTFNYSNGHGKADTSMKVPVASNF